VFKRIREIVVNRRKTFQKLKGEMKKIGKIIFSSLFLREKEKNKKLGFLSIMVKNNS
jgi:hypothetical protein